MTKMMSEATSFRRADGSNRSVVPSMKTKGGTLRLLDIAAEKVDPVFVPVVNQDQSRTTIGSANG
jgi:hypothetical protein